MRTPVRVSVPESFIPPASPFRRGEAGPQPALSLSFLTTRERNVRRWGAPGYIMLVSCSGQLAGSSVFIPSACPTTRLGLSPQLTFQILQHPTMLCPPLSLLAPATAAQPHAALKPNRRTAAWEEVCPSARSGTRSSLLGADARFFAFDWISLR